MWISSGSGGWIHADLIADSVEEVAADLATAESFSRPPMRLAAICS
jgi:hypothetical protein